MKLLLYIFFGWDGFYEWKVTAVLDFFILYYNMSKVMRSKV